MKSDVRSCDLILNKIYDSYKVKDMRASILKDERLNVKDKLY
jgi:hypothetical protein